MDEPLSGQDQLLAGAAYWMAGHQRNLKAGAGRQHTQGQPDRTMAVVQLQIFWF